MITKTIEAYWKKLSKMQRCYCWEQFQNEIAKSGMPSHAWFTVMDAGHDVVKSQQADLDKPLAEIKKDYLKY